MANSGAIDLSGACSGFLYALALADGFLRVQRKSVLVVAANILSRRINFSDPKSAVLFGDAAGATILSPTTDLSKGLFGVTLTSDGNHHDLITIPAGGSKRPFSLDIPLHEYKIHLNNGKAIFNHAIRIMVSSAKESMELAGLDVRDIQRFIPHQANLRIFENVATALGIEKCKIVSTISEYGNSSAASIPFSLSLSTQAIPFKSGEKILLTAAGAGLTGGAMIISI